MTGATALSGEQERGQRQLGRVLLVRSGHEVTREAGYRLPRQSGIAPLSLARSGSLVKSGLTPAFVLARYLR
jgi:hypothetical protein